MKFEFLAKINIQILKHDSQQNWAQSGEKQGN